MSPTVTVTAQSYVKWDSSRGGSFYRFRCVDADQQPVICKMDEKFRPLVEPVFEALDAGQSAELVVLDGGDPLEFRISLDHYRGHSSMKPHPNHRESEVSSSGVSHHVDAMRKITLALLEAGTPSTAWTDL